MKFLKYYNTGAEYTADAPNRVDPTISYEKSNTKLYVNDDGSYVHNKRDTWNVYIIDVDGTVLSHEYLNEGDTINYPTPPTHEGYTFIQWNQTATTANSTDFYKDGVYNMIVIGPQYELTVQPEDTTFDCYINTNITGRTYGIRMSTTTTGGATIDWGDGNSTTTTATTTAFTNYTHSYTTTGKYTVTIKGNSGTYSFSGNTNSVPFIFDFKMSCTSMTIGSYCESLSTYGLVNCYNIKEIKLHKNLKLPGGYNFQNCYNLNELILPSNLTSTTVNVVSGCYSLRGLVFPNGFKNILSILGLPYGVNFVSFPNTLNATSYQYPLNNPHYVTAFSSIICKSSAATFGSKIVIETVDDEKNIIETSKLKNNNFITDVIIPTGTTKIAHGNFSCCKNIRRVTFNNELTTINANAFYGNELLENVILPDNVTLIENNAFYQCFSLKKFKALGVTSASTYLFGSCYKLSEVELGDLKSINSWAFSSCGSLREISFPNLTGISSYAFYCAYALKELTIPSSLTWMSTYTFHNASSLNHVYWNSDLGYLGAYAFSNCSSLRILEYGDNLTKVPKFGAINSTATGTTASYIANTSLIYIVVPDALYDEWYASSYWVNYKPYIIKRSDYELIKDDVGI